ncbi:aminoacyl-tRNA deacylase [Thioalkalivibrio paradoxus]|uniref:Cys-tRNA(Pro)/Cys-tRNA(Cys) deacylase n=1 Tax=Thioalkalivibrio paradoxus ARh 1 TaxID=713585 RepID=W0DIS9_9GAMM|nr:aminoacyl-tRNA deacylase [Thioalkalivibrio paradoxus]AHE98519.1 membrane protein [Thioalkalivibrio paradoxus ARh 1]
MGKPKEPVTAAVRVLRAADVAFEGHPYRYVDGGGTAQFAREHGVDERSVIKTLVMEDEAGSPLIVLMHGDRQVSVRELARQIGAKHVQPCAPADADRHSGYQVGGTSPFGTRWSMPVYCEASIAELPRVYINGGKRGYIVSLATADLLRVLDPILVHVAQPELGSTRHGVPGIAT